MIRRITVRDKVRGWFDGVMSRGMIAEILALVLISLVVMLIIGMVLATMIDDADKPIQRGMWESLLYILGKGSLGSAEGSIAYLGVLLFATIYSLLFTAVLIGLITGGIRSKMDSLARTGSKIVENGHTIILGYNNVTFSLLGELVEANRNQRSPRSIVVLGNVDKTQMEEEIHKIVGTPNAILPTRIICRSGSIYDFADLERCSIDSSRAVIVNANSDFETTKAILACTQIMNNAGADCKGYIVATVHDANNLASASIAGRGKGGSHRLVLVPMQNTIARIMVQTSRQPGLSSVYTELFNFSGQELYVVDHDPSFKLLRGMNIATINRHLVSAIAVGKYSPSTGTVIGDPREVYFEEGDSLIVAEADDDELKIHAQVLGKVSQLPLDMPPMQPSKILIVGSYAVLGDVLREYSYYLQENSVVCVADSKIRIDSLELEEVKRALLSKGITVLIKEVDVSKRRVLCDLVDEIEPDNVLVLCASDEVDYDKEDELVMKRLLYLQECRHDRNASFGITSEMNLEQNRRLASAVSPDGFIVGRHFAALLMAQVSQRREMRNVFLTLLSHEGYELYLRKASGYVELGATTDFYSLGMAVAERGEILLGVRQKVGNGYGRTRLNPPKYDPSAASAISYRFGPDDYLVVLANE